MVVCPMCEVKEPFHMLLTLKTKRLTLVPLEQEDFPLIKKMWQTPSVMQFIGAGVPFSDSQAEDVFAVILSHQKKYGYSLQKVVHEGELIGYAGLIHYELDDTNEDIEVGYLFDECHWGKGFASEVVPLIVAWGLAHLKRSIVGVTNPSNKASQQILRKSGLTYVGKGMYRGREVDRFETSQKLS